MKKYVVYYQMQYEGIIDEFPEILCKRETVEQCKNEIQKHIGKLSSDCFLWMSRKS